MLACRASIEPDQYSNDRRNKDAFEQLIPPLTTSAAKAESGYTFDRVMKANDVISRIQGAWVGRFNFPNDPAVVMTGNFSPNNGAEHRLLYAGPPASSYRYADFKITKIGVADPNVLLTLIFNNSGGAGSGRTTPPALVRSSAPAGSSRLQAVARPPWPWRRWSAERSPCTISRSARSPPPASSCWRRSLSCRAGRSGGSRRDCRPRAVRWKASRPAARIRFGC